MTFAVPAALWGLLAIPCLILLYLLRVRRRDHPVSTILLWQRSAPTLAASRPSRRIERSVLLLLQILATVALVTALARPSIVERGAGGGDVLLVLDLSLSMRARDVAPTRFDRARDEAMEIVAHLRPGQRAGLITAGPRPLVRVTPTEDRDRLVAALRELQPWDASGDVAGAVRLAAAHPLGPGGRIVAWTDGARGPLPALPRVAYRILGSSDDNVGITAFRALRDPRGAEALVRVENFGTRSRRVPLEVTHDGATTYRAVLDLPPGASRTVVFPITAAGRFTARLAVHDILPDDDSATAILDPAPLPSVLVVGPGDPYLENVLRALPVVRAAATRAVDPTTWRSYGVVILDRVDPGPIPPGDYLLIRTVPPNLPVAAAGDVRTPDIASWDRTDPVLQFVDLRGVRILRALQLVPEGGRVLVGGTVPLLWAYEGEGVRALLLPFALQDSDLPMHVAFPLLVANGLGWLGGGALDVRAGETLQIPAGGGTRAQVIDPEGHSQLVPATAGMFLLPPFQRAGVYRLTSASGERQIVARIGDPRAGMVRPGPADRAVPSAPGTGDAGPLVTRASLWPWFLLAALGIIMGEWVLATRREGDR